MVQKISMLSVLVSLQDPAGSGKGSVTVAVFVVLAVLVILVAGYFLLRKRK